MGRWRETVSGNERMRRYKIQTFTHAHHHWVSVRDGSFVHVFGDSTIAMLQTNEYGKRTFQKEIIQRNAHLNVRYDAFASHPLRCGVSNLKCGHECGVGGGCVVSWLLSLPLPLSLSNIVKRSFVNSRFTVAPNHLNAINLNVRQNRKLECLLASISRTHRHGHSYKRTSAHTYTTYSLARSPPSFSYVCTINWALHWVKSNEITNLAKSTHIRIIAATPQAQLPMWIWWFFLVECVTQKP